MDIYGPNDFHTKDTAYDFSLKCLTKMREVTPKNAITLNLHCNFTENFFHLNSSFLFSNSSEFNFRERRKSFPNSNS